MLHFENIVYGPIHSRRLGASLGVNILPPQGKLCNFDCIYCECGWNRDNPCSGEFPSPGHIKEAMSARFSELAAKGEKVDSITFSGNGEPTLHPDFPEIIDITISLRDLYLPSAKISVLSNATRCTVPEIVEALKKTDNPILKLDATSPELADMINKPVGKYDPQAVISALEAFRGDFILQTMFLRYGGFDSSSEAVLLPWMAAVRHLRPRKTMVYSIDRETPQKGIYKFDIESLKRLVKPLLDEGFDISFA